MLAKSIKILAKIAKKNSQYSNGKIYQRQLACISGPNGQRIPGYVRQILTGAPKRSHFFRKAVSNGQHNHHEESTATNNKKRVSFVTICSSITHYTDSPFIAFYRNDEKETSSSSTGQRFTHPTGDPVSSDALWPNRSCLDNGQYPGLQQPDLEMPLGANLLTFNEIQVILNIEMYTSTFLTMYLQF